MAVKQTLASENSCIKCGKACGDEARCSEHALKVAALPTYAGFVHAKLRDDRRQ